MFDQFLYIPALLLTFSNHVLAEPIRALDIDFPDPCLIHTDQGYYAFATNGNGINVRIASSTDFMSWDLLSGVDALPGPFPPWVASSPAVWAPDVIQRVSQDEYCKKPDNNIAKVYDFSRTGCMSCISLPRPRVTRASIVLVSPHHRL